MLNQILITLHACTLLNSLVLSSILHSVELFFHAEGLTIQLTWNDSWCITNIMNTYGKIVMITSTDKLINWVSGMVTTRQLEYII